MSMPFVEQVGHCRRQRCELGRRQRAVIGKPLQRGPIGVRQGCIVAIQVVPRVIVKELRATVESARRPAGHYG